MIKLSVKKNTIRGNTYSNYKLLIGTGLVSTKNDYCFVLQIGSLLLQLSWSIQNQPKSYYYRYREANNC